MKRIFVIETHENLNRIDIQRAIEAYFDLEDVEVTEIYDEFPKAEF